jgi:beta-N-acetylhexosaminidase
MREDLTSLDHLSLRERAGQVLFPRIGSNMQPPVQIEDDAARVEALLDRCPVGGLIAFNGRLGETSRALASLQELSPVPLLIGADVERGVGQQVAGETLFPHGAAFGVIQDEGETLLEAAARITAREALANGIHVAFVPVADVNRNPKNPIIATRAFGSDPERVARLVRAYVKGCKAEGLLCTAKHFPGHGNTDQDSHEVLPSVSDPRPLLEQIDLVPFKEAIEEGVDLIMTAHVAYPALDPTGNPATFSRAILRDLLRQEMGFTGTVVTDSLLMGAVSQRYPDPRDQAAALLNAGVDVFLDIPDPESMLNGIIKAVEEGLVDEETLDEAVLRVLGLKQRLLDRFGTDIFTQPWNLFPNEGRPSLPSKAFARQVAGRSTTILKSNHSIFPVVPGSVDGHRIVLLFVDPHRTSAALHDEPLCEAFLETYPESRCLAIGSDLDIRGSEEALRAVARADRIVIALVVKPAAWRQFGLLPKQEVLVQTIVSRHPVVLISLGSPHILERFDDAPVQICTYSDSEPSQYAAVDVLSGASVT